MGGFRGHAGKLYYENAWVDGANVPASPSWNELKKVVDLSQPMGETDADVSSRESDYQMDGGGSHELALNFGYRIGQKTDTHFEKLVASKTNYSPLLFLNVNGPHDTTGIRGWQFVGRVKDISKEMPYGGAVIVNVVVALFPGVDASGDIIQPSRYTAV